MWRVIDATPDTYIMSIINLGCTEAAITLKSDKGNISNVKNLINGVDMGSTFRLLPEKTLLIEISR